MSSATNNRREFGEYGIQALNDTAGLVSDTDLIFCKLIARAATTITSSTLIPANSAGDTTYNRTLAAGDVFYGLIKDITISAGGDLECVIAGPSA
jgi:hypothetical protein